MEQIKVYIVHWEPFDAEGNCFERFEPDDGSMIGVYSTRPNAEAAIERSRLLPGFCDYPQGFVLDEHVVDHDHWTRGFPEKDSGF